MFLRMVARPLMAKVKQTTGIKKVPEDAVPNAREVLIGLYSQILNEIKKLPEYFTSREMVEEDMNDKLEVCRLEENVESIPSRILVGRHPVEVVIEEARRELSEVSGFVADWISCTHRPLQPPSFYKQTLGFVDLYETSSERELLIQLYLEALIVVRKVPENNKLRMFAESSITRKLKVSKEECHWESIKSKLDYEDPIQKAREELDHWRLFFGPDAYPDRQYPHVPRTKEFYERFNAWRELALPESWKINYDKSIKDGLEIFSKIGPPHPSGKDTPTVGSGESPFKP